MIHTYSDNAVMAKVKALYGKRLTENDYNQLVQKKTVGEVAAYLKHETYYAENLDEVKEDLIHRGQLENLIRRRPVNTYTRLLKYAYQETLFLKLYVMQNEIEQLLTVLRLLNSDSVQRYIIALPVYLARLMSFDLFAVAGIRRFDDLLNLLEHSPYYRIVGRFRPAGSHHIVDITACEAALLTYYYQTAMDMVDQQYRGETRDDLHRMLLYQVNIHNISVIYRMRRYLNAGKDMILPRIVRIEGGNSKLLDCLLEAPDIRAMQEILSATRSLRRFPVDWSAGAQRVSCQIIQLRRQFSQRLFRFSTHPVVAVLSYMIMLDIEIDNLVNIIEGIRYGVPPAELKVLLAL